MQQIRCAHEPCSCELTPQSVDALFSEGCAPAREGHGAEDTCPCVHAEWKVTEPHGMAPSVEPHALNNEEAQRTLYGVGEPDPLAKPAYGSPAASRLAGTRD